MARFDWTVSHLRSADVFTPYFEPWMAEAMLRPPRPKAQDRLVALFASHPADASGRYAYAAELMRHIEVHSFGRRLKNRTLENDVGTRTKLETIAGYKFTLAFENAIEDDYVTEKLYQPLAMGSVPVYLGAPNVEEYVPGDHCFIDAADFPDPKALAKHLRMLNRDADAYAAYQAWRCKPLRAAFLDLVEEQRTNPLRRLCRRIREACSTSGSSLALPSIEAHPQP